MLNYSKKVKTKYINIYMSIFVSIKSSIINNINLWVLKRGHMAHNVK